MPDYTIEDAKSETLMRLKETNSDLDENVVTKLIKILGTNQQVEVYAKDPTIQKVIAKLNEELGKDYFAIFDHWGNDSTAVGICSPYNKGKLVYISTFEAPINHYNVRLELPPSNGSVFPYTEAGKFYSITYEELVDIVKNHLKPGS